jgi:predicted house-cleaning noncanonical NTP pyrophosphatase (MazG superfamily)
MLTPASIFTMKKEVVYHLARARGYKKAIKKLKSMKPWIEDRERSTLHDLIKVLEADLDTMTYSEAEYDEFPNAS